MTSPDEAQTRQRRLASLGSGLGGMAGGTFVGAWIYLSRSPSSTTAGLDLRALALTWAPVAGLALGTAFGFLLRDPRWLGRRQFGFLKALLGAALLGGAVGVATGAWFVSQAPDQIPWRFALHPCGSLGAIVVMALALAHIPATLEPTRTPPGRTLITAMALTALGVGAFHLVPFPVSIVRMLAAGVCASVFAACVTAGRQAFARAPGATCLLLHPAIGALIGGAIAGALNGASLVLGLPRQVFRFPTRTVFEGAFHGGVLAFAIALALTQPRWQKSWPRIAALGLLGHAFGATAYLSLEWYSYNKWFDILSAVDRIQYWDWAPMGMTVALGIALGHRLQARDPERASTLRTLFLSALGAVLGALPWWLRATWSTSPANGAILALCHGYIFGVCFVLGTKLFRRWNPAERATPPEPEVRRGRAAVVTTSPAPPGSPGPQ